MSILSAIPIIGKLVGGVTDIVDQYVPDKDLAAKLKSDIETKAMSLDYSAIEKEIEAKAKIITAEAEGGSWLQKNWRPGIMAIFGLIIFNNYVLNPWLSALFSIDIKMDIPPDMWALLKLGIGGYIASRGIEKSVERWKR